MAHRFSIVLIHLIFSTKNRVDSIPGELQPRLWAYLVGIGRNHEITIRAVGGTSNHVHLLIELPADVTVAKAVQVLKANSSRWMGEHGIDFQWQEGYGAFSVSSSQSGIVKNYIDRQPQHHAKKSYEDEFLAMLQNVDAAYEQECVFG
jgi:REP element-mobilizing transposase RayT